MTPAAQHAPFGAELCTYRGICILRTKAKATRPSQKRVPQRSVWPCHLPLRSTGAIWIAPPPFVHQREPVAQLTVLLPTPQAEETHPLYGATHHGAAVSSLLKPAVSATNEAWTGPGGASVDFSLEAPSWATHLAARLAPHPPPYCCVVDGAWQPPILGQSTRLLFFTTTMVRRRLSDAPKHRISRCSIGVA